jgi:hypothetical protein
LHRRQRHALGSIIDGLAVRPPCRRYASAEVDECLFRNVDVEGADGGVFDRCAQAADGGLGIGGRNRLRVAGGREQDKAEGTCGR